MREGSEVGETKQRTNAVVNALLELSEILEKQDDFELTKKTAKVADPEFLRCHSSNHVTRWIPSLLYVLTSLYDKGYEDSINDIHKLR